MNEAQTAGLMSSATDLWATPQWLFDQLDEEFHFTLDPCSTHDNAKCERHFTEAENGLNQTWAPETVWMNPPYGREISGWVRKAYEESRGGGIRGLFGSLSDGYRVVAHLLHESQRDPIHQGPGEFRG